MRGEEGEKRKNLLRKRKGYFLQDGPGGKERENRYVRRGEDPSKRKKVDDAPGKGGGPEGHASHPFNARGRGGGGGGGEEREGKKPP